MKVKFKKRTIGLKLKTFYWKKIQGCYGDLCI